ncbi:hypothetical protein D3C87_1524400 [compost metagenome]
MQSEVFRDPLAQNQFPRHIAVAHAGLAAAGHRIPAFSPDGKGKVIEGRLVGQEGFWLHATDLGRYVARQGADPREPRRRITLHLRKTRL